MKNIFLAVLEIFIFLLLLPLVIAFILAFQTEILGLPVAKEVWLLWGAGIYVFMNLFIYDFKAIYMAGKNAMNKVLGFLKPPIPGYVIPVYAVLFILIYLVILIMGHASAVQPYFFFALAFTLTMHIVLTAKDLYETDQSILKAHYWVTLSLILITNILLIALLLAWIIPEFSFFAFIKSLMSHTCYLYHWVYKALFVESSI